jgi:hypothetical protein
LVLEDRLLIWILNKGGGICHSNIYKNTPTKWECFLLDV